MRGAAVALIPRVRRARRLAKQNVYSPTGYRPMLDASWYNKDLAGVEGDGAVLQFDVERALERKEKIVRVVMLMPVEWPLELSHQYVVVVIKKNQDLEAAGRDINDCLVVLRAAAGRLAPDAQTKATLRKQEVAIHDLAIRAEVHPDPEIRKTAEYFQQKTSELRALSRSAEEIRTRLLTQIDRLEKLKTQLNFNHAAAQIAEVVKDGMISLDNLQAITEETHRIVADLDLHRRNSVALPPQ
jgi:methyl-accepting chemotaxis protein